MTFKIKDGLSLGANTVIDATGNITVPGKTTLSNTTATAASLNLGTGTADPSSPVAGDFWNNTGVLKIRQASATKTIAFLDSNITGTAANVSTGTVAIANGGTNTTTTPTTGAVAVGNGTAYAFTAVGTAGQVLTSAAGSTPTWTNSTSANTFSAIVQRDASGNFSAGTITAALTGTATNATNLVVTDDTATNATYYPSFALGTSSNQAHRVSSTKLTFNPSTGILASTGFSGSGASITAINTANISTGTLVVARGGTAGSATPTAGAIAFGDGTAYAFTAVGTAGQVLTSAAGSTPIWTSQGSLSVGSATNATNSTNANNVAITADSASAGTHYVHFGAVTTGNTPVKISSSGLYFQPSTATLTVGGALTVGGNLTVNGTTTTVNSTTTTVDDPIFTIGGDTAPASDDNKDRGIEFRWHNGTTAKVGFFGYDDSTSKFTFVPDATNTSEVFSGTKGTIDANLEWTDILNKPDPVVTVTLTGDVTGTANTTLTDLASGTVTVATTIAADSVALGTDTTGNYVATVAAGTPGAATTSSGLSSGLTITAVAAATGTAATIAHANTSTLTGTQGTAGISSITIDGFGHVTGVTTATYLTAEADTLASVTGRGATTSTASSFTGGLTVGGTGIVYNGSTSGSTTFRASATAGTTTITLPATTGTVALAGDTQFIGTTSVALNRASANLALTGISSVTLPGATSGTVQIIPTAIAGTGTVLTLPATTGTVALSTGNLSQFAATTSSQLAGVISDETGSGALVFATSPSLTTPSIGVATGTSFNSITGLSSTTPVVAGTAAIGTGTTVARADHVHPAQTTVSGTAGGLSATLSPASGGTGVANNAASTITISGNFGTTFTVSAATSVTLPTSGTLATTGQTFSIGTTSIAINRASAAQSLTGITSIDGYAAGLVGGNATTLLGSIPYQSAANTTTLLAPNTTVTKRFLRSTGDGTNGTAPVWDTIVAGDIPTLNQSTTGSAATLTTARTINGVSFNGSTDITVTAAAGTLTGATLASGVTASSLTSVGTLASLAVTGTVTGTSFNSITGLSSTTPVVAGTAAIGTGTTAARNDHVHPAQTTVSGNAGSATVLATARAINGVSFDGSAAITVTAAAGTLTGATLASGVTASSLTSVGTLTSLGVGTANAVAGTIVASGNITAFSDIRLKKDLVQIPTALDKVQQLTGFTYTRIDSGERQTGLVAQDVQKVLPEAIVEGEYLSVAYGNLVGLLVEAIKELRAEVAALKENK
jgi:hypothetical protein